MSLISRVTTWVTNQILTSSALNGEFNNITNLINNLDAATTSWTNVKTAALSMTGNVTFDSITHGIVGASGTAAASTGNIGETLTASASAVAIAATATNLTSLSITAGVWLVIGTVSNNGAAASNTFVRGAISANTGSFTGTTDGLNNIFAATNSGNGASLVTRFVTQSSTATWYLVCQMSTGSSNCSGTLAALRIA